MKPFANFSAARLAVKTIFFLNGFVHANYYSRLPRIQDQFSIHDGTIGLVLLSSSIGALLAMPFTGWLIIRNGSRRVTLTGALLYCLLVPLIPMAPSLPLLVIVFFLLGVFSGMLDVAMNAQAVMVEQQQQKPIMTSFHALFSVGMMAGALTGSAFSSSGASLLTHLASISLASAAIIVIIRLHLVYDRPVQKQEGPAFRLPNAAMISIGIIAFCCMLGEGAMADWSTNFMERTLLASESIAPLGLSAFAMAMTVGRMLGDSARVRLGDYRLMVFSSLVSLVGMGVLMGAPNPSLAILGFVVVGLGLASVVPIAYSIAGNAPNLPAGVGLAMVTTVGYAGFLFGPPIIGMLANAFSLRWAFGLVLVLFGLMTILSTRYRK
ncbi:MAG: MFS transporter [Cyclobacteriaceae bacterium]|nr:MFS transporter [Cyclobacteriaceae bacterium]